MRYAMGFATIVLVAGATVLSAAAPTDPAAGAALFKRCAACHSVDPSGRNGLGPNLRGVVGRHAGGVADFNYSPAMKASSLVWTDATLASFLASPRKVVPGTRMAFAGLANPKDQADLIAYLKQNGTAKK